LNLPYVINLNVRLLALQLQKALNNVNYKIYLK
jgi:hypothetical protein